MCIKSWVEPEEWNYVHLLIGGGEAVAKLHLQEETIFDLKQQLSTMQWRFDDLKHKHEELKSQLSLMPIKRECMQNMSYNKYYIVYQYFKSAVEETPGIQLSLPPVKEEGAASVIHLCDH